MESNGIAVGPESLWLKIIEGKRPIMFVCIIFYAVLKIEIEGRSEIVRIEIVKTVGPLAGIRPTGQR
jgi:hypothetical protein